MNTQFSKIYSPIEITYVDNLLGGKMPMIHYHEAYEIYFLEKGTRSYIINDSLIELSAHDVVLIKPREVHTTDGGSFRRYLINFSNEYLSSFFTPKASEMLLECFKNKKVHIHTDSVKKFISCIKD